MSKQLFKDLYLFKYKFKVANQNGNMKLLISITFSAVYFHRARLAWSAMDCEVGGAMFRVDTRSGFGNTEPESAD